MTSWASASPALSPASLRSSSWVAAQASGDRAGPKRRGVDGGDRAPQSQGGQAPLDGRGGRRLIGDQHELRYRIDGKRKRELVIITGELADVTGVDVWVSSENTNMQMARYYDRSISSLVRYLGAVKDEAGTSGRGLLIADELSRCMVEFKRAVQPATVVATGSGELQRTHGVKRVYHVAAVYGQVGVGYKPVGNIAKCVTNALTKLDAEDDVYASIIFPCSAPERGAAIQPS